MAASGMDNVGAEGMESGKTHHDVGSYHPWKACVEETCPLARACNAYDTQEQNKLAIADDREIDAR